MKREKWLTLGLIVALVMSPVTDVYAQESNGTYETVGSGDYEESQVDDNRKSPLSGCEYQDAEGGEFL